MCGIFGTVTNAGNGFPWKMLETFIDMMHLNSWRGADSTGVVSLDKALEPSYVKVVGGPGTLIKGEHWAKFRAHINTEGRAAFGHGRAATKGNVALENAHPFLVKKPNGKDFLYLVHNGTLTSWQSLPGFDKFSVDSLWMATQIATLGPEEALARIRGPIATVWWDTELETLNFYRNHERPLHIAREPGGDLYFQSEACTLAWAKLRRGLEYKFEDIHQLAPEVWSSVNIKDSKLELQTKRIEPKYGYNIRDVYNRDDIWANREGILVPANEPVLSGPIAARRRSLLPVHVTKGEAKVTCQDFDEVMNGTYQKITYAEDGRRKYMMRHNNVVETVHINCAPPEPKLTSIRKSITGQLCKTYTDGSSIEVPYSIQPKEFFYSRHRNVTFAPNREVKWNTPHNGAKLRHRARCSGENGRMLINYSNKHEGEFKIGMSVNLQMISVLAPGNIGRVAIDLDELRADDISTGSMRFRWIVDDASVKADELWEIGFFQGVIKNIMVTTDSLYQETGMNVIVFVADVEPMPQNTVEEMMNRDTDGNKKPHVPVSLDEDDDEDDPDVIVTPVGAEFLGEVTSRTLN